MIARQIARATKNISIRQFSYIASDVEIVHHRYTARHGDPMKVERRVLPNEIRLVTREGETSGFAITFAINAGSNSESVDQKGAAHFLSTNALAGSLNTSGLKLSRSIEKEGMKFFSSAGRDKIVYRLSGEGADAEDAFKTLAKIAFEPDTKGYSHGENIERERQFYETLCPNTKVTELVHEAAFGAGTPYGSSMYSDNIDSLTNEAALRFRSTNFKSNNIIIVSHGVEFGSMKHWVDKHLGQLRPDVSAPIAFKYQGGEVRQRGQTCSGKTYASLAFFVPTANAKSAQVLEKYINGKVKGGAFCNAYAQGGLLGFRTSGDSASISQYFTNVVQELKSVASKGVDAGAITKQLTLEKFISLESGYSNCVMLNAELRGQTLDQYVDFRGVSSVDVKAAANAILASAPSFAVYGNSANAPTYEQVRSLLK